MRILLVLFIVLGLGGPAAAFTDADRSAVQSTILQQLNAFLADDAATAYSFAAPNIKMMYPTEEQFMQMVQQGYPQVYRPRAHSFGEMHDTPRGVEQFVDIVDGEGRYWTARYTLELQDDGSWKITGCYIVAGIGLHGEAGVDLARQRAHDPEPQAFRALDRKTRGQTVAVVGHGQHVGAVDRREIDADGTARAVGESMFEGEVRRGKDPP
jgi:hypothetical protein